MARVGNEITAAERKELHKAKMAGKKMNREAGLCDVGFTPSRNNGWRSFVRSRK
ncbi:hypothetical protein ACQKOE_07555 [Novosphingobium sp. NPDC080210]|uniref:hypothetical protein n=1 Tax=Novosphingobium sp. NPDC080210 TaxID=3390596 RepID=UPI003D037AC1